MYERPRVVRYQVEYFGGQPHDSGKPFQSDAKSLSHVLGRKLCKNQSYLP